MLIVLRKDILSEEKERLDQLLSKMEKRIADAFRRFIADTTSEPVVRLVLELVERGEINAALAAIDQHIAAFAGSITQVFVDSATAESVALLQQMMGTGAAPVSISFDPTNPRAAALMRQERLEFIREFSEQQRIAVRNTLAAALQAGDGPRAMAADFRAAIGLTQAQMTTVDNYRRLLDQGSAEALQRSLRDRRFDSSIERAVSGDKPLSAEQIDKQVGRYRQRMLAYRAENIARTEAGRALSLGRDEAMQQAIESGAINAQLVEQRWNTIMDGRERDSHAAMNGQIRPWGQPFVSGAGVRLRYPHDPNAPASEVVNCRCNKVFVIRKAAA